MRDLIFPIVDFQFQNSYIFRMSELCDNDNYMRFSTGFEEELNA